MQCDQRLTGMFPIEHSDLYNFWKAEKEEILKNKYYLSEKLGRDVGFDYALWDWHMNFRSKWIESGKY